MILNDYTYYTKKVIRTLRNSIGKTHHTSTRIYTRPEPLIALPKQRRGLRSEEEDLTRLLGAEADVWHRLTAGIHSPGSERCFVARTV